MTQPVCYPLIALDVTKTKTQVCFIIVTLKWTKLLLSFALLLQYVVIYVPTDLQEKVLVELQEEPSLSQPGMELDLGLDLGP